MKKPLSFFLTLVICLSFLAPASANAATIKINKTKATIEVGSLLELEITGTQNKVTWKSSKVSVASVNSSGTVSAKKKGKAKITATVNGKKYICSITVTKSTTSSANKLSRLSDVISSLKKQGLLSGDESPTLASMIGGNRGVKYLDSNAEIYEYDKESDAYKSLVKTNTVRIEGIDIDINVSAINGKFILLCEYAENKDKIIKAFKELNLE